MNSNLQRVWVLPVINLHRIYKYNLLPKDLERFLVHMFWHSLLTNVIRPKPTRICIHGSSSKSHRQYALVFSLNPFIVSSSANPVWMQKTQEGRVPFKALPNQLNFNQVNCWLAVGHLKKQSKVMGLRAGPNCDFGGGAFKRCLEPSIQSIRVSYPYVTLNPNILKKNFEDFWSP